MGVFLDIQAAFDSIKPEHIKNAILKHGCHPDMVDWYYELITHRNLITTYENFVLEVTTNMGFPQGGVCSAKFWICLLYTSPSPRDRQKYRMPSSA